MNDNWEVVEVLWEHKMITDAEDRYWSSIEKKALADTRLGQQLLEQIAEATQHNIENRQDEATAALIEGRKKLPWKVLITLVGAETASISVVQALMSSCTAAQPPSYQHLCMDIAEAFVRDIRFYKWQHKEKKYASRFLKMNSKVLSQKAQHLRFARSLEKKIESYLDSDDYDLTRGALFSLGALLLDCIKQGVPDLLSYKTTYKNGKASTQTVYWSDSFLSDINKMHAIAAVSMPTKRPMLVPPMPWRRDETGNITGGYYLIKQLIYRVAFHKHRFNPSDEALDALNAIQKTPWQVNEDVLRLLVAKPQLGHAYPANKPKKLPKEIWESLIVEEQKEAQQKFYDDTNLFISLNSKAMIYERQLMQAMTLQSKTFWQPHSFDFRGRLYPSNQMLTTQGDHIAKGLIRFANGKRLGPTGLRSLKLYTANCYGFDKLNLDERLTNLDSILPSIMEINDDNVAVELLLQADEPMTFYAAAMELRSALLMKDSSQFVSHQPIAIDGVCNGLQVLSLLGKDSVGAEKTNCTDTGNRQDLYLEVAKEMRAIVEAILEKGAADEEYEAAVSWYDQIQHDKIARATVKRATMTKSYGVTHEGIREQLVQDRMCDNLVIPDSMSKLPILTARHRLAGYMRDWIVQAQESSVKEAVKIMDYFKACSKKLGEADYAMSWVTQDGCEVKQEYVVIKDRLVRTFDNFMRRLRKRTDELSLRQNSNAAAPNVVHSLDATMLRLVARKLSQMGISDMAFIHDSYAVHACHIDHLNRIIREVAVTMFKGNWLQHSFHEGLVGLTEGQVELPKPPQQGDLNVEDTIPHAIYFFS